MTEIAHAAGWAGELIRPGESEPSPWRREGELVRLRRGVYLPRATWQPASETARFLWRVRAAALEADDGAVFSHLSAAALWGLPMVAPWPDRPHVTLHGRLSERSNGQTVRTVVRDPFRVVERDGIRVTTLERTVVDVARSQPLSVALPMVDRALALGLSEERVRDELGAATTRGIARARLAVDLGDARAGSPGESVSRAAMYRCQFPLPELQRDFHDHEGRMSVDFYWPELRLIGEFDGRAKYEREDYLNGMTAGEAVVAEKRREDRLRALGERVTRWDWRTAWSLPEFRAHLMRAGLRPRARR